MMNYVKSEFYRITHTGVLYWLIAVLMGLSIIFNFLVFIISSRYTTTSFSYSMLVGSPMCFPYAGVIVIGFLYDDGRKNGNLKNTIASGIPRGKILFGKCVVSVAAATVAVLFTLLAWIISAELLLEKSGPVRLENLLTEVPVVYLLSIACMISALVLIELFSNMITAMLMWGCLWVVIPKIIMILGIRFHFIHKISLWIPGNLFAMINGKHVNMTECITAWDTMGGLLRCVIPGLVGIIVFLLAGNALVRRRDL